MSAVASGDDDAFSFIYDQLSPLVYGICKKVLGDKAQSEEVKQEVFLEVWRLAPRYKEMKGSVKSWVAVVAHRRAVDRVRSEQAARNRDNNKYKNTFLEVDVVAEEVVSITEHQRVSLALQCLTLVQREAVELAYYGGYTYSEVASRLGVPPGTIKTRIRDGLIKLRLHLEKTSS